MFKSNVEKAKEKFCTVMGGKSVVEPLLKIKEPFDVQKSLKKRLENTKNPFSEDKLKLLLNDNGIVDLLSKSLFTSSKSNFVKLVKGTATDGDLIYLLGYDVELLKQNKDSEKANDMIKQLRAIRSDLDWYVNLNSFENEERTDGKISKNGLGKLTRNKNKGLVGKLQNSRLIDTLKILVTYWLLYLAEKKIEDIEAAIKTK